MRSQVAKRSRSRASIELTAWSAVSVLALGLAVLGFGVIAPVDTRATEQVLTPVVEHLAQRTVRVPMTSAPVAAPLTLDASIRRALGPPPGAAADTAPARTAAPADRYAFLFGVSRYRKPTHDTIGGANDVQQLASLLVAQGWLAQNITVVTDEQATGTALRAGLAWLAGKSQAGRTFSLFHYSGHVRQTGGGRAALWPVDSDFVPDAAVVSALQQVRGKLWADFAGCEAAAFLPGLPSSDVLVSASSTAVQKSYEYPPWTQSVWAGLVFTLGIGQGGADADRDGRVTVGEALRYATYYAQAITFTQQPYGRQSPQSAGDPVRGWTLADPPA